MSGEALPFAVNLLARIKSGDGEGESLRATLGGWFVIGCHIFADDKLILSGS